jgi:hypothetical protein
MRVAGPRRGLLRVAVRARVAIIRPQRSAATILLAPISIRPQRCSTCSRSRPSLKRRSTALAGSSGHASIPSLNLPRCLGSSGSRSMPSLKRPMRRCSGDRGRRPMPSSKPCSTCSGAAGCSRSRSMVQRCPAPDEQGTNSSAEVRAAGLDGHSRVTAPRPTPRRGPAGRRRGTARPRSGPRAARGRDPRSGSSRGRARSRGATSRVRAAHSARPSAPSPRHG